MSAEFHNINYASLPVCQSTSLASPQTEIVKNQRQPNGLRFFYNSTKVTRTTTTIEVTATTIQTTITISDLRTELFGFPFVNSS